MVVCKRLHLKDLCTKIEVLQSTKIDEFEKNHIEAVDSVFSIIQVKSGSRFSFNV